MTNPLTRERLAELFSYDENTGLFTRLKDGRGTAKAGQFSGWLSDEGYLHICIDRKTYKSHRLAWLFMYGAFPDGMIDHINCIRSDNRIANLRIVTPLDNARNSLIYKTNKSGFKGVSLRKRDNTWRAECSNVVIGYFADIQDAKSAVEQFREKFHGQFANHG